VVTGKDTAFATLYTGKILDPIRPVLVLPEVVDPSKWWQGRHKYADREDQYIFVFTGNPGGATVSYNTKVVDAATLKSYWDLVDPKWKGKIVAFDPRIAGAGTTSLFFFYHPPLGPNFVRRLYGERDVTLVRDYRQSTDWLAQGKFAFCVPCTDVSRAKRAGLPIAEVDGLKEGEVISSKGGTLSLVNRAPHPNAAKVFINWLLSREGQIEIQKGGKARSDQYDSLRVDIPKDIPEDVRRKEGVMYFDSDAPQFADRTPVDRLLKEILK
jgi:iron(III) transport system substrate-binding protein